MLFFRKKRIRHVLVHQCGKVGSSTLTSTIRASAPDLNVLQVHFLTDRYMDQFREMIQLPDAPSDFVWSTEKLLRDADEARRILRDEDPREVCVITACRDPLDLALSAMAQSLKHLYPGLTYSRERRDAELKLVLDDFDRLFDAGKTGHRAASFHERQGEWLLFDTSLFWFEREFCPAHGLTERQLRLGKKDLLHFRHRGRLFLVYRFEAMRQNLATLVRMLPLEAFRNVDKNVSSAKAYGTFLSDLREAFHPRQEVLDFYYRSRHFETFYAGRAGMFAGPRPARPLRTVPETGLSAAHAPAPPRPLTPSDWRPHRAKLGMETCENGRVVLRCATVGGGEGVWGGMLLGCTGTNVCDGATLPCDAGSTMTLRLLVRGGASHEGVRLALNVIDNMGVRLAETMLVLKPEWTTANLSFATRDQSRFLGIQLVKARDETPAVFEVCGAELRHGMDPT